MQTLFGPVVVRFRQVRETRTLKLPLLPLFPANTNLEYGLFLDSRIPANHTRRVRARSRNASHPRREIVRPKPRVHSLPLCQPLSREQGGRTVVRRWSIHSHLTQKECHSRAEWPRQCPGRKRVRLLAQKTLHYKWTQKGRAL